MPDSYLQSLLCPLPEDIAHLKGAGLFDEALELIRRRLLDPSLPTMLRTRLETERMFLKRLPRDYTLTRAALAAEIREAVPSFRDEEVDELVRDGRADFIFLNGEMLFHEDLGASLLKAWPALRARSEKLNVVPKSTLDPIIEKTKTGVAAHITIKGVTTIADSAFLPGALYRIHMPIPQKSMQQTAPESLTCTLPFTVQDGPQQCMYMEFKADKNEPITFEYSYTQRPRYVDPLDPAASGVVYPDARPVCAEDLSEHAPHITFTPYLISLANGLKKNETDPVQIARTFYDYVTTNVTYAYQRPYLLIENGAEYTAVNRHGDCGLQALLFITLCRIVGIPARWQSGLCAEPGDVGSHDWAEFYTERFGWLPADCSYGGGAWRNGALHRWNFYFGNLDPWRMVANRDYYAAFTPAKKHPRFDPYDSQRGEIETEDRALAYGEFRTRYTMTAYEEEEIK